MIYIFHFNLTYSHMSSCQCQGQLENKIDSKLLLFSLFAEKLKLAQKSQSLLKRQLSLQARWEIIYGEWRLIFLALGKINQQRQKNMLYRQAGQKMKCFPASVSIWIFLGFSFFEFYGFQNYFFIIQMSQYSKEKPPRKSHYKYLLFISLLVSESTTLLFAQNSFQNYDISLFTIFYFSFVTTFCLKIVYDYSSVPQNDTAILLEYFEHLGVLLSSFILKLYLQNQNSLTKIGIFCGLLLVLQFLLMVIKILYYGSVLPGQIAQISTLIKLLRQLKITVITLMPLFITSQMVFIIVFAVFQVSSAFLFFFKFTYQQSSMEYILMIATIGGLVSTFESIISLMIGIPHFFLGQCLILGMFLFPDFSLRPLLELKYLRLLSLANLREDAQTTLTLFRFMRECLFEDESTFQFSKQAKGKCWLLFVELLKMKNGNMKEEESVRLERNIWEQLLNDRKLFQQQFFEVLCKNVQQKTHFQSFAFKLECSLKLKTKYIKCSLIMYYDYLESIKNHINVLEMCKIQRSYKQIAFKIANQNLHIAHINYIKFAEKLKRFFQEFNQLIIHQSSIIQSILLRRTKKSGFLDAKLIDISNKKQHFNMELKSILKDELYLSSNQFKMVLLIYYISILKQPEFLKTEMKKHFISTEFYSKTWKSQNYLVVLNGFRNGEITNFNQRFKNKFKISKKLFSADMKDNISKYFVNPRLGKLHGLKMSQFKIQKQSAIHSHSEHDCWLVTEGCLFGQKMNFLQNFTVTTRIYYQNPNQFSYICQIQPKNTSSQLSIFINSQMLPKIHQRLQKNIRGYQRRKVIQFQQEFQVIELYLVKNNRDTSVTDVSSQKLGLFDDGASEKTLSFLDTKKQEIERNIFENNIQKAYFSSTMLLEVASILCIAVIIMFVFLPIQAGMSDLSSSHQTKKYVRDSFVLKKKIYLQQQILNLIQDTPYYPSQVCQQSYIQNITTYMVSHFTADLYSGFDDLLNLVFTKYQSDILVPTIFTQNQPSQYLLYNQRSLNFIQFIQLLKGSMFSWLNKLGTDQQQPIDFNFYAYQYPKNILQQSYNAENTPFTTIDKIAAQNSLSLAAKIKGLKLVLALAGSSFIIWSMILRLKENGQLLKYLDIFENFPPHLVQQRLVQLKLALNRLQKLRTSYIYEIQWQNDEVLVKSNQQLFSGLQQNQSDCYHRKKTDNFREDTEQMPLITKKTTIQLHQAKLPERIKNVLIYNKVYLIVFTALLATFLFTTFSYLDNQLKTMNRLQNNDQIAESISDLQQNYINLLAYNWLKATSLNLNFNMVKFQQIFNQSIAFLQQIQFQQTMLNSYPNKIANLILYEDICSTIIGASLCKSYRNGALTSGFSVLLTLIVNQAIMFRDVSSNYTYHLPNLCDKTFLFFDVFIPMAKQIPIIANQMVEQSIIFQGQLAIVGIYLSIAAILLSTLAFQKADRDKKRIIEKELLSFDKVENLYRISELKPLLNKAYYL